MKGRLAFTTPARLTTPTVRYITRFIWPWSRPSRGAARKTAMQLKKIAMLLGKAERRALPRKVPTTLRSLRSKDMKNAGKASITASMRVI